MKKTTLSFLLLLVSFSCMFANGDLLMKDNPVSIQKNEFLLGKKHAIKQFRLADGGDAFQEGTIAITAGYGFPNLGKSLLKYVVSDTVQGVKITGVGPLHFKVEYGLSSKIGLGLSVNYVTYGAKWNENGTNNTTGAIVPYFYDIKFSSLSVLARFNVHFGTTDKLDPYWGIGAGYKTGKWTFDSNDPDFGKTAFKTPIPFGFETTVGLRYYFTDMIGFYAELGIAKSVIQGGIAIKL